MSTSLEKLMDEEAMFTSPWKLLEGQVINDQYHLRALIGVGGFAGVFRADMIVGGKNLLPVAVKLLSFGVSIPIQRQLDELQQAILFDHPSLIRCYSAGQTTISGSQFLFLVMQLAEFTLEQRINTTLLSHEETLNLTSEVIHGLRYLHERTPPVVHCDIKPANIVSIEGHWKISDFGISRVLGNLQTTYTTSSSGTICFLPPEGFKGIISPARDYWSLGVLQYRALTGSFPFDGASSVELMHAILNSPPKPLSNVTLPLQRIIMGCLTKNRESRWGYQEIEAIIQNPNQVKRYRMTMDSSMPRPVSSSPHSEIQAPLSKQTGLIERSSPGKITPSFQNKYFNCTEAGELYIASILFGVGSGIVIFIVCLVMSMCSRLIMIPVGVLTMCTVYTGKAYSQVSSSSSAATVHKILGWAVYILLFGLFLIWGISLQRVR